MLRLLLLCLICIGSLKGIYSQPENTELEDNSQKSTSIEGVSSEPADDNGENVAQISAAEVRVSGAASPEDGGRTAEGVPPVESSELSKIQSQSSELSQAQDAEVPETGAGDPPNGGDTELVSDFHDSQNDILNGDRDSQAQNVVYGAGNADVASDLRSGAELGNEQSELGDASANVGMPQSARITSQLRAADTPSVCNNGICEKGESECGCEEDCGPCCGDGICKKYNQAELDAGKEDETGCWCVRDCPEEFCCGNTVCEPGEDECNCVEDCGPCCGDGVCFRRDEDECGPYIAANDTYLPGCETDCGECCGDGVCEADEDGCKCFRDCCTCDNPCCFGPDDCLSPEDPGYFEECNCVCDSGRACCGDGVCSSDQNEDCSTCVEDCSPCCGDKICDVDECHSTCTTCDQDDQCDDDCLATNACCGNDICERGETAKDCVHDCGPYCGDGYCETFGGAPGKRDEDSCNCIEDCPGHCCGNRVCEIDDGETPCDCPQDCGPCCGDKVDDRSRGETPCNCPDDFSEPCCGDQDCDSDNGEDDPESAFYCCRDCLPCPPRPCHACSRKSCHELSINSDIAASTEDSTAVCGRTTPIGGSCPSSMTWPDAWEYCDDMDMRLCCEFELDSEEARLGDCDLDDEKVWTADVCVGGHITEYGGGMVSEDGVCTDDSTLMSTRCCGDTDLTDPDICCDPPKCRVCSVVTCTFLELNAASNAYDNDMVCGDSDHSYALNGACYTNRVWRESKFFCTARGMRLCTLLELETDEVANTGCDDDALVWSSQRCGRHHYIATRGSSDASYPDKQCLDMDATADIRCCADDIEPNCCECRKCSENSCQYLTELVGFVITDTLALDSHLVCSGGRDFTSVACAPFDKPFDFAQTWCDSFGMRLCDLDEVNADEARDLGCTLDLKLIWTRTPCLTAGSNAPGFMVAQGQLQSGSRKIDETCLEPDQLSNIRCCADDLTDIACCPEACQVCSQKSCHELELDPKKEGGSSGGSTDADNLPDYSDLPRVCATTLIGADAGSTISELCHDTNFEGARNLCMDEGMRLCTAREVKKRELTDTPCGQATLFGGEVFWTSTACNLDRSMFYAVPAINNLPDPAHPGPNEFLPECLAVDDAALVGCCADVNPDHRTCCAMSSDVAGSIYTDSNSNGQYDDLYGIMSVGVELWSAFEGIPHQIIDSTTTDLFGNYAFHDILEENYMITLNDVNNILSGHVATNAEIMPVTHSVRAPAGHNIGYINLVPTDCSSTLVNSQAFTGRFSYMYLHEYGYAKDCASCCCQICIAANLDEDAEPCVQISLHTVLGQCRLFSSVDSIVSNRNWLRSDGAVLNDSPALVSVGAAKEVGDGGKEVKFEGPTRNEILGSDHDISEGNEQNQLDMDAQEVDGTSEQDADIGIASSDAKGGVNAEDLQKTDGQELGGQGGQVIDESESNGVALGEQGASSVGEQGANNVEEQSGSAIEMQVASEIRTTDSEVQDESQGSQIVLNERSPIGQ